MADQTSSRLLDQVHDAIRLKHYSIRTEEADVDWIKRFILFHKTPEGSVRHPQDMGAAEIAAFLTHLAVDKNVAASTQNQALRALLFFYRNVLGRDVILSGDALRAKKPRRLPTVLTKEEVHRVLNPMTGMHQHRSKIAIGYTRTCSCPPHHLNCLTAKEWITCELGVWQFVYEGRDIRDKSIHSATFPIALSKRVMSLFTHEGELVLDPFVGSGTTLLFLMHLKLMFHDPEIADW